MNTYSAHRVSIMSLIGLGLLLAAIAWLWIGLRSTHAGDDPVPVSAAPAVSATTSSVAKGSVPAAGTLPAKRADASEPPPKSFAALIARFSPQQQQVLKAFYAAYGNGMMQFSTPEQLAWLKRRGFPMPEDVLAAQFLSDEQLQTRAKAGDAKSAAFLADRWMQRTAGNREAYKSSGAWARIAVLTPKVMADGSPFGGYFYARVEAFKAPMQFPDAPHIADIAAARSRVVGLAWAGMLGDGRANGYDSLKNAAMYKYFDLGPTPGKNPYFPHRKGTNDFRALLEFVALLNRVSRDNQELFAFRRTKDVWPSEPKG